MESILAKLQEFGTTYGLKIVAAVINKFIHTKSLTPILHIIVLNVIVQNKCCDDCQFPTPVSTAMTCIQACFSVSMVSLIHW
jgi:hypothetical protein